MSGDGGSSSGPGITGSVTGFPFSSVTVSPFSSVTVMYSADDSSVFFRPATRSQKSAVVVTI